MPSITFSKETVESEGIKSEYPEIIEFIMQTYQKIMLAIVLFVVVSGCNEQNNSTQVITPIPYTEECIENSTQYESDSVCAMRKYIVREYSIMIPDLMRECEREELMEFFDYGFCPIDNSHYARVLFQFINDDYSDIAGIINKGRHFSREVEEYIKDSFIKGMRGSSTPIIDWYGVDYVKIGNLYAFKKSYLRKGFPGTTHVDQYSIYTNTEETVITVSYQTDETTLWRTNLNKSVNSLSKQY